MTKKMVFVEELWRGADSGEEFALLLLVRRGPRAAEIGCALVELRSCGRSAVAA